MHIFTLSEEDTIIKKKTPPIPTTTRYVLNVAHVKVRGCITQDYVKRYPRTYEEREAALASAVRLLTCKTAEKVYVYKCTYKGDNQTSATLNTTVGIQYFPCKEGAK